MSGFNDPLQAYEECRLCGHQCGKNRLKGELGECGLTDQMLVSSAGPHYGEEPELVGYHGSGTIFFAGCNLSCRFCQNWEISQAKMGEPVSIAALAEMMLTLERRGCHNVNLVTPTPFTPSILVAVRSARARGLTVPIVYNCGGYESRETLALCSGWIEIYMPDAKYSDEHLARLYSGAEDYPRVNRAALQEMHRQVGDLVVNGGIASRGLLVRHLVLPGHLENSRGVLEFIADEISPDTYVNIMDQYRPCYQADHLPGMNRRLSREEYLEAVQIARGCGLHRGFAL
jgi:putative pyruvate formate lyase activating enzyme